MERKSIGSGPAAALLLAVCSLLTVQAAAAADVSGRLGVGITILPVCHLITQTSGMEGGLSAPAVNIRCAKGMGYSVSITPPAFGRMGTAGVTTLVTVNF